MIEDLDKLYKQKVKEIDEIRIKNSNNVIIFFKKYFAYFYKINKLLIFNNFLNEKNFFYVSIKILF